MEKVVKTGTVYRLHKGVMRRGDTWRKCSARVIETDNDGVLKLECESEKDHVVSLQLCSQVLDHPQPQYSRDHVIELMLQRKTLLLGLDTAEEALEWRRLLSRYSKDSLSHIDRTAAAAPGPNKRQLPPSRKPLNPSAPEAINGGQIMEYNVAYELDSNIPPLEVEVKSSPLSEKLGLQGKLHLIIEKEKLTVRSINYNNISVSWQYKTIRKYGRDRQTFSMEVGRRSPTGPGVLVFKTRYGNDIFHRVQKNTVAINARPAPPAQCPGAEVANAAGAERRDEVHGPNRSRGQGKPTKTLSTQPPPPLGPALAVDSEYSTIEAPPAVRRPPVPEEAYCLAEELREDAWRTHGRMEENVHTEFYTPLDPTATKPEGSGKAPAKQTDRQDGLYGQVSRRQGSKMQVGRVVPVEDGGVYSTLDHGPKARPHLPPARGNESEYDLLDRPGERLSSPPPPSLDPNQANQYDCLSRGVTPSSNGQGAEDAYNVIDRPITGNERLVNLVDDGSGYMTNAGGEVPEENEYSTADVY